MTFCGSWTAKSSWDRTVMTTGTNQVASVNTTVQLVVPGAQPPTTPLPVRHSRGLLATMVTVTVSPGFGALARTRE